MIPWIYKHTPWLVVLWYRITLKCTRVGRRPLPKFGSYVAIRDILSKGRRWSKDPVKGKFDVMYHPSSTYLKILDLEGEGIGDCEDHAIFWAITALNDGLATEAWIGNYVATSKTRDQIVHAVCLLRDKESGHLVWVDYRDPEVYTGEGWAEASAKRMAKDAVVVETMTMRVTIKDKHHPRLFVR